MSKKVKKIVRDNWKVIAVGVVCITVTYIVTKRVTLRSLPMEIEGPNIDFLYPPANDLVEVHVPKIYNGMQGNAVYNPATRVGWFNQELAARAHDVSRVIMSKHLHGKLPNVKGEVLERANFRIFVERE